LNAYELILLLDPKLGEEKIGLAGTKIEEKIKALGGSEIKTEKWGMRKLASIVKKAKGITQAYYVLIRFQSAPNLPAELKAFLKVNENVVRYFVSKAVEVAPVEERIEGKPLEAVNVGEIKSLEEEAELGKP